jgi:hypothetical protein
VIFKLAIGNVAEKEIALGDAQVEQARCGLGFLPAHVAAICRLGERDCAPSRGEFGGGAAAADFDVIGVRTEEQDAIACEV